MVKEFTETLLEKFEFANYSVTIPQVFEDLYGADANFETATSNTIQPLKIFFKALKTNAELYETAKSSGLIPTFANYAKTLSLTAEEFLKIAFKFPRFSKADIAKLSAKLEMEAKANRLTRTGRRHRSSEDVREAGGRGGGLSFSTPQHRPSGTYPIHQLGSELLSKDQLVSIWDELPERIISDRPTLGENN